MGILKDIYDIGTHIIEKIIESFRKRSEQRALKTILNVMTPGKTWQRSQIVALSQIKDEDVLRILRCLQNMDKVIEIKVDEEPEGTLWRIMK